MEETNNAPTISHAILNTNIDVSDNISNEEMKKLMLKTFHDIVEILSDHCGPYGKFAMITNPFNKVAEPVFTKDGIGIVRALEYASPIQEYARGLAAYMGSRIESAAGDGTTSSMIILLHGIAYLMRSLPTAGYIYNYTELYNGYMQFVTSILRQLDQTCNHVTTDDRKAIYNVAYCQAYTSSHGDKELAEAVATMFADTPRQAWNFMYIDKDKYESNKRYRTEVDTSQYSIQNVRVWPDSAVVDELGTARIRENTPCLISAVPPATGFEDGIELYNYIVDALKNDQPLTVICPRTMDNSTMSQLSVEFHEHPNNEVCLILASDSDMRMSDITCLHALANDMSPIIERNLSYTYTKGELKIKSGLYKNTEDSKLNPCLGKPEYEDLNKLVASLDNIIKQIKSEVANRQNTEDLKRLQKLRLKLTVAKRTYFVIGGSAYDNAAATDVVLDAILATKHTLTKGYVLGGNKTLYKVLYMYMTSDAEPNKQTTIHKLFANMFIHGIIQTNKATLVNLDKRLPEMIVDDKQLWLNTSLDLLQLANYNLSRMDTDKLKSTAEEMMIRLQAVESIDDISQSPVIIQPVSTDMELLKRFGELALKFVETSRILSPGGYALKPDSKASNKPYINAIQE